MSEQWRQKRYYKPRVILSTDDVLNCPYDGALVFLSGAHLALVKNLLAYAHRRITFSSEYHNNYYLTPTVEQWDALQAITADLEDILMSDCCETLNATLEAINTTLGDTGAEVTGINTSLQGVDLKLGTLDDTLAEVRTAIECICTQLENATLATTVNPAWTENETNLDYWQWGNHEPNPTIGAQADEAACAMAQLWYHAGFEIITETVLPSIRFGFDTLVPAAAALIATWTGGLALPAAIGVYLGAELIQELLELGYNSAETNLVNWLFNQKEDLVCPMYAALQAGGSASGIWPTIWADVVEPSDALSWGDKIIVRLFMGGLALSAANVAYVAGTPWATSTPVSGFCDSCEEPPVIGSDWVAVPYLEANKELTIVHPPGSSWNGACLEYDLPDGFTCVGMLFHLVDVSGNCDIKAMGGPGAGCAGPGTFVPNNSNLLASGYWYYRDTWNHDHDEVVATLAPGASQVDVWSNPADTITSLAWMLGWNCEGQATFIVDYLVYGGTTPP